MKKFGLLLICVLFSCQPNVETESKPAKKTATKSEAPPKKVDRSLRLSADGSMQRDGIKLTPVKDSPGFEKATLQQVAPQNNQRHNEAVQFKFTVENYDLGNQTSDASNKLCANSEKGQHIHSILNNDPYEAYYRSAFSKNLKPGHYVHLAFLSRSYHESIKEKSAYQMTEFYVGDGKKRMPFDAKAAHLFYSRPKGNYIGEGSIERILLDFYLVNTDLSTTGNKVRVIINGTEFILKEWIPYWIEGLPMGANNISLELIDAKGQRIPGRFNFTQRKFHLHEDEPIVN